MRSQDPRSQSKQVPMVLKWPVHTGISTTPWRESPCTFCAHQGVKLLLSESLHLLPRGKTKTKQNTTTKKKPKTKKQYRGSEVPRRQSWFPKQEAHSNHRPTPRPNPETMGFFSPPRSKSVAHEEMWELEVTNENTLVQHLGFYEQRSRGPDRPALVNNYNLWYVLDSDNSVQLKVLMTPFLVPCQPLEVKRRSSVLPLRRQRATKNSL